MAATLGSMFLLLVSVGVAPARGRAESLDLEQAMILARQQTHEVAAAKARTRARSALLDQARAHRLPEVSLSEVWTRTDSPADVFGLLLNQERFSFQEFVQTDPNDPEFLENAVTRLEMSVPVYTGGELSTRIEQAEKALEAAEDESDRTGDEVAFRAGESYLRLVQARERVELVERAVETVEAHVDLARAYVDEGLIVSSELLRAEVEAARLRDELASARSGARVAEAAL
ncbi:MAG: TolC family protein, partial [Thermoanaerobaculia bacterium]|nr:TolC family protein [Thermoanaerobaculia bacterium]